jgi:hypothetical protein
MRRNVLGAHSSPRFPVKSDHLQRRLSRKANARSDGAHPRPRIFKLLSAFQADLVGPLLDRKHAALVAMTASEQELKNAE